MLTLIKKLRELSLLHFTGRVHLVEKDNGPQVGLVSMAEGLLVGGLYRGQGGIQALAELVLEDGGKCRYLVEPEILSPRDRQFEVTLRDFLAFMKDTYYRSDHLRPPLDLKILVKEDFVSQNGKTTPMECDLLKIISHCHRVGDVYKYGHPLESVVTSLLVSLRKKGALKVVG